MQQVSKTLNTTQQRVIMSEMTEALGDIDKVKSLPAQFTAFLELLDYSIIRGGGSLKKNEETRARSLDRLRVTQTP